MSKIKEACGILVKECTKCKQTKNLELFYSRKNRPLRESRCIDCMRQKKLTYYYKNKEQENEKKRMYDLNRMHNDLHYRLKKNIRNRFYMALNRKSKKGSAIQLLGCTIEELIAHIEKQFYENPDTGECMNWTNWSRTGWHIDHIIPLFKFNLADIHQLNAACHYTNLRPLWSKENLARNKTY